MNRFFIIAVILFIIPATVSVGGTEEGAVVGKKNVNPLIKKIEIGMRPSQVRTAAGMPRNMTRKIWRYDTFFVLFESGQVACLVDNTCFGKWPNCRAYKQRSGPCVKK